MSWRLLDTGHLDAASNMAIDDILLDSLADGISPNTFRFLQFDPPAVLVGYHQSVESEVRIKYCHEKGIDINRRITGGGAILFDPTSLGWEIIASKNALGIKGDFFDQENIFHKFCNGTILGLNSLGIKAEFRPKNDIEVNGRKISGTGGTQREEAFLFQGTLLIDMDVETMLRALRIPMEKLKDKEVNSVKERVTSVKEELGYLPSLSEIKARIIEGFQSSLGLNFERYGLSDVEQMRFQRKLTYFMSYDWIYLERSPLITTQEVQAITKTPGGLIRASLVIDNLNIIRTVLLTGDFFVYPQRAILDLEAALRGEECTPATIKPIVENLFKEKNVKMLDVNPQDLIDLILNAALKMRYREFGFSPSEANHIYEVNIHPEVNESFSTLLLPYCAKLPSCEFRDKDGCTQCGACSIGNAYRLAEEYRLRPITIVNFEDLIERLNDLKKEGSAGFIGCCCEGFYCKHQDDFEKVDLPGLLIDIDDTTCYELGKEHEALIGDFENKTNIKLDLLTKVIKLKASERKHAI